MKPAKLSQDDEANDEAARELKALGAEPLSSERAKELVVLVQKAIRSGVHGCARGRPQNDNE